MNSTSRSVPGATTLTLQWNRCEGGGWCPLVHLNLAHPHFDGMEGVYVIWHGGPQPAYVRVGQGAIRERLAAHRLDPAVQAYAHLGLSVTWAQVPARYRGGVERYLAERLHPKVGDRFPFDPPIAVNLP
jgi:hypothetical protein